MFMGNRHSTHDLLREKNVKTSDEVTDKRFASETYKLFIYKRNNIFYLHYMCFWYLLYNIDAEMC